MKPLLAALALLFILQGCKQREPNEKLAITNMVLAPPKPSESANSDIALKSYESTTGRTLTDTSKKIIKTGDIRFETNDPRGIRLKIMRSLKKLDGYVAEESETNLDSSRGEFVLKLRVPAKNFDQLLDNVSADAGKIDSKNINVRDVTTQYIDIKMQLANKRVLENTYLGLLKKAGKIGDVLQIENKITDIRTEIDSTQGELNYLSKQAAFSSLSITFYTNQIQHITSNVHGRFISAIIGGWGTMQDLFFSLLTLWPVLLTLAAVYYVLIKKLKKGRKFKTQQL
ncbi:MAG: DUF4349 domain-containing protein [Mucilaginibacter sp.]